VSARSTPPLLWLALLILAAYAALLFLWGVRVAHPPAAMAGGGLAVLWVGLRRGRFWAFLLTSVLGIATGVLAFEVFPALTLGNAAIVIPVLAARRYFAGPDGRGGSAAPLPARFCPHCGRELTRAAQAPCPVCAPEVDAPRR